MIFIFVNVTKQHCAENEGLSSRATQIFPPNVTGIGL
jgi:hypothetical protein